MESFLSTASNLFSRSGSVPDAPDYDVTDRPHSTSKGKVASPVVEEIGAPATLPAFPSGKEMNLPPVFQHPACPAFCGTNDQILKMDVVSPQYNMQQLPGYPQFYAPAVLPNKVFAFRDIGSVELRYFDLGSFVGRGGAIRFFLLGKQIRHLFTPVTIDESWPEMKERMIQSGFNQQGCLPVLIHDEASLCESTAILRYLAKRVGEYGADHLMDYRADMVVDKLAYWRDELMAAIQEWDLDDSDHVGRYMEIRHLQMSLFEALLNEGGPWFTVRLTWCDFALFSLLFDDQRLMETQVERKESFEPVPLSSYPSLMSHFQAIKELPLITQWLEGEERQIAMFSSSEGGARLDATTTAGETTNGSVGDKEEQDMAANAVAGAAAVPQLNLGSLVCPNQSIPPGQVEVAASMNLAPSNGMRHAPVMYPWQMQYPCYAPSSNLMMRTGPNMMFHPQMSGCVYPEGSYPLQPPMTTRAPPHMIGQVPQFPHPGGMVHPGMQPMMMHQGPMMHGGVMPPTVQNPAMDLLVGYEKPAERNRRGFC